MKDYLKDPSVPLPVAAFLNDIQRAHAPPPCPSCEGTRSNQLAGEHPMTCQHIVTRGREGEKGSWCEACSAKVLEVHDRPCSECQHYRPENERAGICRKMLMRVTADMHVTYWLVEGPGRYGLCFEATS